MATICMHHVLASMRAAVARNGSQARLLIGAGINPQLVADDQRRVHTEQVARLFKSVQLELDDEFMGFSAGHCRVGAFKTMCDLVRQCRTLGDMLHSAVEFYRLLSDDLVLSVQESAGRCVFSVEHRSEERDPDHFLREFLLVIWHRFPSWYIGEAIRLRETHFSFERPAHHGELQVMFPGILRYGQKTNRLVYDASYLDKPLVRSQKELDLYARNAPADVMTIPGADNRLEWQIERILTPAGGDPLVFPTLEALAAMLEVSAQTLYRQLRGSGTSYQKIKDDIRRETAIRCLVEEGLSVETVSERVGFSEARSFTRAFRHWTGMSPRNYRNIHRIER
ncbi:MAG: AraC family transcriptional regulator [Porticoccaceae bacterium]